MARTFKHSTKFISREDMAHKLNTRKALRWLKRNGIRVMMDDVVIHGGRS